MCTFGSGVPFAQAVMVVACLTGTLLTYGVYRLYSVGMRELKRLDSVTKSPNIAFFTETLSGVSVVRAFGVQARVLARAEKNVDATTQCSYTLWCNNQWMRVQMNMCGCLVTISIVFCIFWTADELEATSAGLVLSYSTQFMNKLMNLMATSTQLEVNLNSVERIQQYATNLPLEAYDDPIYKQHPPPPSWPTAGAIKFVDVRMQYASASEPVFDALSFELPPRMRVGIVGRTGAGKSSLATALFRLVELSAGRIEIDGVDIRHVGLPELRGRLCIIQQEPTLFKATLRYNLSPIVEYSDAELWEALSRAGLEAKARAMGGLEADVSEGGSNMSGGERQLLCMARALLRRCSVLLMDEATASVDADADGRIQSMIKRDFHRNTTVLTIAHRLHTIAFYERVLVLERGRVLEYDAPAALLADERSAFRKLALETGDLEGLVAAASKGDEPQS